MCGGAHTAQSEAGAYKLYSRHVTLIGIGTSPVDYIACELWYVVDSLVSEVH